MDVDLFAEPICNKEAREKWLKKIAKEMEGNETEN